MAKIIDGKKVSQALIETLAIEAQEFSQRYIDENVVIAAFRPNKDVDGKRKLVGDVDFNDVEAIANAITPVPVGVGPMTMACLMQNTLTAAREQVANT